MKKVKQVLAILLVMALMAMSFVGCDSNGNGGSNVDGNSNSTQEKTQKKISNPIAAIKGQVAKGEYDITGDDFSFHITWEVNDKPSQPTIFNMSQGEKRLKKYNLMRYAGKGIFLAEVIFHTAGEELVTELNEYTGEGKDFNFIGLAQPLVAKITVKNTYHEPRDGAIMGNIELLYMQPKVNAERVLIYSKTTVNTYYWGGGLLLNRMIAPVRINNAFADGQQVEKILQSGESYTLKSSIQGLADFWADDTNPRRQEEQAKQLKEVSDRLAKDFVGYGVRINPVIAFKKDEGTGLPVPIAYILGRKFPVQDSHGQMVSMAEISATTSYIDESLNVMTSTADDRYSWDHAAIHSLYLYDE